MRLEQGPVCALHANTVVTLEIPTAGALLSKGAAEEPNGEDDGGGSHCLYRKRVNEGVVRTVKDLVRNDEAKSSVYTSNESLFGTFLRTTQY